MMVTVRLLYSFELYRSRVLELNASDERGIQVHVQCVQRYSVTSLQYAVVVLKCYMCSSYCLLCNDTH